MLAALQTGPSRGGRGSQIMARKKDSCEGQAMPTPDADRRRLRLVEAILRLPESRLEEAERLLLAVPTAPAAGAFPAQRDWPHAPLHRLSDQGTFIVTAGTYNKEHYFGS